MSFASSAQDPARTAHRATGDAAGGGCTGDPLAPTPREAGRRGTRAALSNGCRFGRPSLGRVAGPPRRPGVAIRGSLLRQAVSQPAQRLAGAREARTDGPNRDLENHRDLLVPHPLQSDQQDHRPLGIGQLADCAFEIAQLEPAALVRRMREERLSFTQPDRCSFPHLSADMINVLIMKYGEQPCPQIRTLFPKMQFSERPGEAVLDEVVGGDDVVSEGASKTPQAGNFGFDVPIGVGHRGSLPLASDGQATRSECRGV
jgi:hypothetical protein